MTVPADQIKKILIIRFSSIGDIILSTPLIRAVRKHYPEAEIDFVVKQEFSDLVKTNPHLNHIYVFDKSKLNDLRRIKKEVRSKGYHWVIDIHKNFRSRILRKGIGAKVTSYHKMIWKRTLLVWWGWNLFKQIIPVYQKYFQAVEPMGIKYDGMGTEIVVPIEIQDIVKDKLIKGGYETQRPLITICPGASFANKRWLPDRFARVADKLRQSYQAQIAFAGGPQDHELCKQIIGQLPFGRAFNFAGKFDLLQSAALLGHSSLVITNDSGLMHLAQAQKVPVVAIFGSTTGELGYFPLPGKSVVVELPVSCRPCSHNGLDKCPKGHFKCMKDITEDQVIQACNKLIPIEVTAST